jgi:hypothetical protein
MIRKVIKISFLVLLICHSSCIVYHYKDLTYYKKEFVIDSFRIDGFYKYQWVDDPTSSHWMCFYNDGTYLDCGTYQNSDTTVIAELNKYPDKLYKSLAWGVYYLKLDTLFIQQFSFKQNFLLSPFLSSYQVDETTGLIITSESLIIKKIQDKKKTYEENDKYYFYPCDNCKPDSLNWLKENKKLNKTIKK